MQSRISLLRYIRYFASRAEARSTTIRATAASGASYSPNPKVRYLRGQCEFPETVQT